MSGSSLKTVLVLSRANSWSPMKANPGTPLSEGASNEPSSEPSVASNSIIATLKLESSRRPQTKTEPRESAPVSPSPVKANSEAAGDPLANRSSDPMTRSVVVSTNITWSVRPSSAASRPSTMPRLPIPSPSPIDANVSLSMTAPVSGLIS